MAGRTSRTDERDLVSELAELGEETIRRLVDVPRRIVAGTMDGVGRRLQGVAMKLGAIDPFEGRVGAIEKRLDALEKPRKTSVSTASGRAKAPSDRKASAAPALEPEQIPHDSGRSEESRVGREPEQDEVPT